VGVALRVGRAPNLSRWRSARFARCLTPRSKLTRYGRRCKPGHGFGYHPCPGLQRLPPRSALARTLGRTTGSTLVVQALEQPKTEDVALRYVGKWVGRASLSSRGLQIAGQGAQRFAVHAAGARTESLVVRTHALRGLCCRTVMAQKAIGCIGRPEYVHVALRHAKRESAAADSWGTARPLVPSSRSRLPTAASRPMQYKARGGRWLR
jgi:hypothetical protein